VTISSNRGVIDYTNTSTGFATEVNAQTYSGGLVGASVAGGGVEVGFESAPPVSALYTRDSSALLDRSGDYITVRT
jgi:hypothetical protein